MERGNGTPVQNLHTQRQPAARQGTTTPPDPVRKPDRTRSSELDREPHSDIRGNFPARVFRHITALPEPGPVPESQCAGPRRNVRAPQFMRENETPRPKGARYPGFRPRRPGRFAPSSRPTFGPAGKAPMPSNLSFASRKTSSEFFQMHPEGRGIKPNGMNPHYSFWAA